MFGLILKMFMELLINIVNASNYTKCVSLSKVIILHPNEYSQEFYCYPFTVKLDRHVGSCNTLSELSYKVCVPNKKSDLNISAFNIE